MNLQYGVIHHLIIFTTVRESNLEISSQENLIKSGELGVGSLWIKDFLIQNILRVTQQDTKFKILYLSKGVRVCGCRGYGVVWV
jgi:hypothetical protein